MAARTLSVAVSHGCFRTDTEVHCVAAVIAQAVRISRLVSTAHNYSIPDCVS